MADRVLITGAAGYIGQKVAGELVRDMDVLGMDIRRPEHEPCRMVQCDIRDTGLERLLIDEGISHVVHLASVLESSGDERRDYDIDVNGTRNLVSACLAAGVRHLTVSSSGAVYGYHPDNPAWIDEEDALRANRDFPYAWHKKLVEEYLAETRRAHPELRQLVLRPGTVLGVGTRNQITNLFEKKRVLAIRGSDSPFVFLWDEDLVSIIQRGIRESRQGIYNLAGDGAVPIEQIAAILGKPLMRLPAGLVRSVLAVGHGLGISRYAPAQVNFLRYRPVLSNRRLREEFGYQPRLDSRETFELFVKYAGRRGQL